MTFYYVGRTLSDVANWANNMKRMVGLMCLIGCPFRVEGLKLVLVNLYYGAQGRIEFEYFVGSQCSSISSRILRALREKDWSMLQSSLSMLFGAIYSGLVVGC
jgi:hypothetical protein